MIEVRFHGRGGQGAVTSAELLALSAIHEGRYAQALPSFGPERRGAPVAAFARLDDVPIRLRSTISFPHYVVVLDPSLLQIPSIKAGLRDGGMVIVNTHMTEDECRVAMKGYSGRLAIVDASKIALQTLKVPITNTAMLGAFAKASNAVHLESFEEPLRERFRDKADINLKALKLAYEETILYGCKEVEGDFGIEESSSSSGFKTAEHILWTDFNPGFILTETGTSRHYLTGDWRSRKPVWNKVQCVKCGVCYIYCPDMAIRRDEEGYFSANLDYCKGCGICAKECVTGCIKMVEEK